MAIILTVEQKQTQTGKPYKSAKLDSQVLGKDRFNIFTFHSRYDDVVEGRAFAVEEFEPDGQYIKLKDPNQGIKQGLGGRVQGMKEVVREKAQGIRESQDRKEENIKVASTFRAATDMTIALINAGRTEPYEQLFTEVRRWLYQEYDSVSKYEAPPF